MLSYESLIMQEGFAANNRFSPLEGSVEFIKPPPALSGDEKIKDFDVEMKVSSISESYMTYLIALFVPDSFSLRQRKKIKNNFCKCFE
jgi:hypothetical protein